jgi:holin-like protein
MPRPSAAKAPNAPDTPSSAPSLPPLRRAGAVLAQVGLLCGLWLVAESLRRQFALPVPAGLIGFLALAAGLFSGLERGRWLRHGANWLLGEMVLFFIPAMLVVTQYPDLVRHDGWRIALVIGLSTVLVMAATALAVDRVHRLEVWLARRRGPRGSRA